MEIDVLQIRRGPRDEGSGADGKEWGSMFMDQLSMMNAVIRYNKHMLIKIK